MLQVLRKKASNDPAFMFYHNPRRGFEEFLRTTSWLKPIQKSSDGEEFPFGNLADIFPSALLGMSDSRNDSREYHDDDLCACVGNGNLALAMSQHQRLGRDSWLGKLTKETLRGVVSFLL